MGNSLNSEKIQEIIRSLDLDLRERARTIHTKCPGCGQEDKLSILKDGGSTICYRSSCSFGGPRPFVEWVMLTASITKSQAVEKVYGKFVRAFDSSNLKLNLADPFAPNKVQVPELDMAVEWPVQGALPLDSDDAAEGLSYMLSRGVSLDIAVTYGIQYDTFSRRVVFPIIMNGELKGWQARAIDPCHPGDRMRNNVGFRRARCVMFLDRVTHGAHVIIAEGPFDAIKFHKCGGNVATLGKIISSDQLQAIMSKLPSRIYLALDDDAAVEMRDIVYRVPVPVYRIVVPASAKLRCQQQGKKADFGECTQDECLEAFQKAQPFGILTTAVHLKN